ncbi:MAG: hypothetical protein KKE17_15805 [Proteobacteria bacterium]|nr:hypothetical protein [Pseudomonadota bacterium]
MKKIFIAICLFLELQALLANEAAIMKSLEKDKSDISIATKLMGERRFKEMFMKLEENIKNSNNQLVVLQSKLLYSTVVLDFEYENTVAVKTALEFMLPLAMEKQLAGYDFIVANLFFLSKKYDAADMFLEKACSSKSAPQKIVYMCQNMKHITTSWNVKKIGNCAEKQSLEAF